MNKSRSIFLVFGFGLLISLLVCVGIPRGAQAQKGTAQDEIKKLQQRLQKLEC